MDEAAEAIPLITPGPEEVVANQEEGTPAA